MNIYIVYYTIAGMGEYIPDLTPDGGFYDDKNGFQILTCGSTDIARKAVETLWPQATITKVVKVCAAAKPEPTKPLRRK